MPEGWKTYKLEEVATIIGGGTPSTSNENNWNGNIPWLTPRDVTNYNFKLISKGERSITDAGLKDSSAKLLPKGTLLLTSRAPIGYLAIANNPICTNQGFKSLIPQENKVDTNFLYYLLKNNTEYIKSLGVGTTFAEISGNILKNIEFQFPESVNEQSRIASILSSLDDKIELNLQMNKTLEAIAQTIFKEWFVDFRFPGFDGVLVGGLPGGWRKGGLKDICSNIKESHNPKVVSLDTNYVGLEHIPRKCISLSDWGHSSEIDSQKSKFVSGDVLFGKLRPYFHKVVISPINGICSTDILVLRAKKTQCLYFSLFQLCSDECIQYANSYSDGTRMPRVNWNSLSKFPISIPTEEILIQFQSIINPLIERINSNIFENYTLTQIRDTLLPKLMTGKIRV